MKEKIICKNCGNEFYDYRCNNRIFCSKKCYSDSCKGIQPKHILQPREKGYKHSEETKKKISKSHIGIKNSKKAINKSRERLLGKKGQLSIAWKGGITPLMKQIRNSNELLQWRSDVFERDNWTCQTCGARGVYIEAHHINGLSLLVKTNNIKSLEEALLCNDLWDINNGVTLCKGCHELTDNYKGKSNKK